MNISGWGQNFRTALPAPVITPQNHVAAAQAHSATGDRANAEESYKAAIKLAKAELAKNPSYSREMALAQISAEYAAFLARENASDASSLQQPSVPESNSASAAHRPSFSSYSLPFPIQAGTEGTIVVQNCQGTINAPVHGKNNTVNVYYSPNLEARQPHAASLANLRHAFHWYYDKTSNLSIQRVSGQTVSLDDCYINLAIVESQAQKEKDQAELKKQAAAFERLPSSERLEATNPNKLIPLDQLFEKQRLLDGSEGIPKRILIQGRAGIGKTTLCKKLVYEYHHNGLWQDRFDSVLWMPLRQLKTHSPQHLEDLLCQRYFADQGRVKAQALGKTFLEYQGKTLFILDGLDEVTEMFDERHRLNHFLNHLLNQAHVLITSRPAGVNASQCNELDLELETIGFSPENVQTYIQKFTPESNQEALQQFIHRTPLIQSLVNIPIQLDALCYSWDKLPKNQAITMSMLYEAMVDKLWRKDSVRLEKEEGGKVLRANVIEGLSEEDLEELMMAEIDYLGYLAFKGLEAEKIEFSREELSQRRKELNIGSQIERKLPLDFTTNLKKTSYLHSADTERPESERYYHFLHLTFQEFFAAKFLVRHLQTDIKVRSECTSVKMLDKGLSPSPSQGELQAFIATNKYNPRYEIVWWMIAGLLKGASSERFFTLLETAPRDLIGIRHQQVMMGCLNEARSQLEELIVKKLETELMQWLHFEIKNTESNSFSSNLGSQSAFPEHLLLTCLNQPEVKKNRIIAFLENRSVLFAPAISALVAALQDEDWLVRSAAVNALGAQKMLSDSAASSLITALQDDHKNVRSAVAKALGKQKILSVAAILALITALQDEYKDVREAATNALGAQKMLSDTAVSALITALQHQDKVVRAVAAWALGRQQTLSDLTILSLTAALQDEYEYVRRAAADALGTQKMLSDAVVSALVAALQDEDWLVRSAAVNALGTQKMLSDSTVSFLFAALNDKDDDVRSDAAMALADQKTLSDELLIVALQHENKYIRYATARILGKREMLSDTVVLSLTMSLQDEVEDVRYAVINALSEQKMLSDVVVTSLIAALQNGSKYFRSAAIYALGKQKMLSDATISALLMALKNEESYVKSTAAKVIGKQEILSDAVISALITALQDSDKDVRSAVAEALGKQKMLPDAAIKALITALQDDDKDVRHEAATALSEQKILSEDAIPFLILALQDEEMSVKLWAIEALGKQKILSNDTVSSLILAFKEQHRIVRFAAAQALSRQKILADAAVSAFIMALNDDNKDLRVNAVIALCSHLEQLFTMLPNLAPNQIKAIYNLVLFPHSCKQNVSLYIQDNKLHFYTSAGLGKPIELTSEQTARIIRVLRVIQAESGIAVLPEKEIFLMEE
ncbi:hypothetical protein EBME_2144 [bacterium endosymbiont of Mortierella elongata FMR23-6]|nr:hypothetical protein EBME_2144 [bacterium endosymbiont of Mortierella elongata FMR23-6]